MEVTHTHTNGKKYSCSDVVEIMQWTESPEIIGLLMLDGEYLELETWRVTALFRHVEGQQS